MPLSPWSRKNFRPFRTVKFCLQWPLWRCSKLLGCFCGVVPPETNIWTKKTKLNLLLLIIRESYAPYAQFLQAEQTVDLTTGVCATWSSGTGKFSEVRRLISPVEAGCCEHWQRHLYWLVCDWLAIRKAVLGRLSLMGGYLQTATCSQGFKAILLS